METLLKNLKKRGFEPYFVKNGNEANELILSLIEKGASIGFGGSMTVKELGLMPVLKENGRQVYQKDFCPDLGYDELLEKQHTADWYISSTNAMTVQGDLINIDGRANRVADMLHGPKNLLVVAGVNKIVNTIDEGIERTRNVSAPKNTVRLSKKTPCAITGKCEYCNAPDTICRATVIQHHPTTGRRVVVIIIDESYGY